MAGIHEKQAIKIAELLTSTNPNALQEAAKIVSKNPYAKRALEKNYDKIVRLVGQKAPEASSPLKIVVGPRQVPAEEDQE